MPFVEPMPGSYWPTVSLRTGARREALKQAREALAGLEGYHAQWVSYQCYDLLGTLQAAEGDLDEAERLYLRAIDEMESLRGNIQLDEFRMSFGRDKYQVYENLVDLKIRTGRRRSKRLDSWNDPSRAR